MMPAGEQEDDKLLPALRLVGQLEEAYAGADSAQAGSVAALDPIRQLGALAERVGRSTDTWKKAWEGVEVLDRDGALKQSHFNVLIAGLGRLPDGASLGEEPSAAAGAEQSGQVRPRLACHSMCSVVPPRMPVLLRPCSPAPALEENSSTFACRCAAHASAHASGRCAAREQPDVRLPGECRAS